MGLHVWSLVVVENLVEIVIKDRRYVITDRDFINEIWYTGY